MKQRIDELLVEKKLFETRSKAQAAIMAGEVLVEEQRVDKPGTKVEDTSNIRITGVTQKFVSRGGLKLEKALDDLNVEVSGRIALDIGASTGGFTDCLLQRGAVKVYAVDVGYGQLAWKLRQDSRVRVIEKMNARNMKAEDLYEEGDKKADLAVVDVSFISLNKILPALFHVLEDNAEVVALVKPQFEARREQVGKGGIIKDPVVHGEVLKKAAGDGEAAGFSVWGLSSSPITGTDGNREFFIHLKKGVKAKGIDIEGTIKGLIGAI